jgi:hypothetical protein
VLTSRIVQTALGTEDYEEEFDIWWKSKAYRRWCPPNQFDVLWALEESPHPKATPWIIEAFSSKDPGIRNYVVDALGKLGGKEAVSALIAALRDSVFFVRIAAIEALAKLKAQNAVEPLIEVLENDLADDVREVAVKALHEITGQNFGWNYQRWRRWLAEREKP